MPEHRPLDREPPPTQVSPISGPTPYAYAGRMVPIIILLLTAFAFVGALDNELVNWDDVPNLVINPFYRGLSPENLAWMFTTTYGGHYQPLSWVSFALDYLLWGGTPFGFHLTNVVLHLMVTAAFFFVARRLIASAIKNERSEISLIGAAAATLLFSIHPLRVESVAWATERRDVLSGFWLMLTLWFYLAAAAPNRPQYRKLLLVAALLCYVLSLLSKASGITLPAVLILLDLYPLRRLRNPEPDSKPENASPSVKSVILEKVAFVIPATAVAATALTAQARSGALWSLDAHPFTLRVAQSAYGVMFYLWKTVWPVDLIPLYEQPPDDVATRPIYLLCAALVAVCCLTAWRIRHRYPGLTVSWFTYLAILAPVLGLAQSGPQLVADRYTYTACMPWAILVGAWVAQHLAIEPWNKGLRKALIPVGGLILGLVMIALTRAQVEIWRDSETLWRTTVERAPDTGIAHGNLASALFDRGAYTEAREHAQAALKILPRQRAAHFQLAQASAALGDWPTAEAHYRRALDITRNLGESDAPTTVALAQVVERLGRPDEAEALYRTACALEPTAGRWHFELGAYLLRRERCEQAQVALEWAVRLEPNIPNHYLRLAETHQCRGDDERAIQVLESGLLQLPDEVNLMAELAWVLATAAPSRLSDVARSLDLARRAVEYSNGLSIRAREALAAALLESGQAEQAATALEDLLADPRLELSPLARERLLERHDRYRSALGP